MAKNNEARFTADIQDFESKMTKMTNDLNKFAKGGTTSLGGLAGAVGKLAGSFGLAFSAVSVLQDAVGKSMNFEKSLSSLQSLTGLGASEMGFFKDAAIELGSTSTQTASQVVDAFKLIGSQKPELLQDRDALKEVTKAAITLAEAAGMEVPDAAKALTGVLNQFGMDASQSTDVINMLAAASQKGAGDINYLNDAVVKAGSVAKSFNVPINEVIAGLEQLAQAGIDSSTAGTGLRNVMLALAKTGDTSLDPSVNGLIGALSNLQGKGLSAVEMMQMFGKENIATAQVLMESASKANEMADAITGTNTAEEQAKINNDNLAGSLKALDSAWEGFILSLNNSNGTIRTIVDGLTDIVNALAYVTRSSSAQANVYKGGILGTWKSSIKDEMEWSKGAGFSDEDSQSRVQAMIDKQYQQFKAAAQKYADKETYIMGLDAAYAEATEIIKNFNKEQEKAANTPPPTMPNGGGGGGGNKPAGLPKDINVQIAEATANAIMQELLDDLSTTVIPVSLDLEPTISDEEMEEAFSARYDNDKIMEPWLKQKEATDKATAAMKEWDAFNRGAMQQGISSLTGAFETLGEAIGDTAGSVLALVASLAQQVAAGMISISNLKMQEEEHRANMTAALGDAAAGVLAAHSAIPFVGVAMGLGMVATIIASLSSLPKFANGAIATGPTYGLFGENGPEAVIPLDRLGQMLGNGDTMGNDKEKVNFMIKNQELVGTLTNARNLEAERR